ncbi:hypothetical protein QSH18_00430 [Xanthomonas sp. NCPPB 2654]|nr:hypothetical protein [Xanthomonas sp. NCPPB 2654]
MAADDSGKIVEIYAHPDGQIALKLDNGLPNSNTTNNCGVSSNPWAGVATTADPIVKAAILSAYTSKSNVTLVTMGKCVGTWIKIEAMHVR